MPSRTASSTRSSTRWRRCTSERRHETADRGGRSRRPAASADISPSSPRWTRCRRPEGIECSSRIGHFAVGWIDRSGGRGNTSMVASSAASRSGVRAPPAGSSTPPSSSAPFRSPPLPRHRSSSTSSSSRVRSTTAAVFPIRGRSRPFGDRPLRRGRSRRTAALGRRSFHRRRGREFDRFRRSDRMTRRRDWRRCGRAPTSRWT